MTGRGSTEEQAGGTDKSVAPQKSEGTPPTETRQIKTYEETWKPTTLNESPENTRTEDDMSNSEKPLTEQHATEATNKSEQKEEQAEHSEMGNAFSATEKRAETADKTEQDLEKSREGKEERPDSDSIDGEPSSHAHIQVCEAEAGKAGEEGCGSENGSVEGSKEDSKAATGVAGAAESAATTSVRKTPAIKQYIFLRTDLPNYGKGALVAQACHAAISALEQHKEGENTQKYLAALQEMTTIVLRITEQDLQGLVEALDKAKIGWVAWREGVSGEGSDDQSVRFSSALPHSGVVGLLNGPITAVATEPCTVDETLLAYFYRFKLY